MGTTDWVNWSDTQSSETRVSPAITRSTYQLAHAMVAKTA